VPKLLLVAVRREHLLEVLRQRHGCLAAAGGHIHRQLPLVLLVQVAQDEVVDGLGVAGAEPVRCVKEVARGVVCERGGKGRLEVCEGWLASRQPQPAREPTSSLAVVCRLR
jgi:hypothetical protein